MAASSVRLTVIFTGHVQGVGFRYQTLKCSEQFDVKGFVRNLPDGTVELVAEGERKVVDRFHQAIETRMEGYVRERMVTFSEPVADFNCFEIQ